MSTRNNLNQFNRKKFTLNALQPTFAKWQDQEAAAGQNKKSTTW